MFQLSHDHQKKSSARKKMITPVSSSPCNLIAMTGSTPIFEHTTVTSPLSSDRPSRNCFEYMSEAIDEALDVIHPDSDFDPLPINPRGPHGVQVLDQVQLGSTWDPNDPNKELVRWLFTTQKTLTRGATVAAEKEEQGLQEEEHDRYEPLDAFSSAAAGHDASHETNKHSNIAAQLNDTLLKPEKWEERFLEFVKFQKEFETSLVPHNWPSNMELAQWVKRQRYQFKLKCKGLHNTLTEERFRALEEVGFIWNSHHALWEEKLQELKEFKKHYGHCNVPSRYTPNRKLSVWVRSQRRQYKLLLLGNRGGLNSTEGGRQPPKSHMTKERFQKLQSLGFEFNPRR